MLDLNSPTEVVQRNENGADFWPYQDYGPASPWEAAKFPTYHARIKAGEATLDEWGAAPYVLYALDQLEGRLTTDFSNCKSRDGRWVEGSAKCDPMLRELISDFSQLWLMNGGGLRGAPVLILKTSRHCNGFLQADYHSSLIDVLKYYQATVIEVGPSAGGAPRLIQHSEDTTGQRSYITQMPIDSRDSVMKYLRTIFGKRGPSLILIPFATSGLDSSEHTAAFLNKWVAPFLQGEQLVLTDLDLESVDPPLECIYKHAIHKSRHRLYCDLDEEV